MAAARAEAAAAAEGPGPAPASASGAPLSLAELPGELLELIACCGALGAADLARLARTCRRLREACRPRGKAWREQLRRRWPSLMKYYNQAESVNWLEEYRARQKAGLEARRIVASFSKRFFSEHVPCDGFSDVETLECPCHFFEDELMSILSMEGSKGLTWKYYAKKILYFLRQQNILKKLKAYLQRPADEQSFMEGAVLIDQYCNPLSDICLESVQAQVDDIISKVRKHLKSKNPRHPSVAHTAGEALIVSQVELQRQVLDAMNYVLYEQLKYKGNEVDYYNSLNSYIRQVLIHRTGIPISLSVLYLTIAKQLGVQLEPVNFPSHFLLRWCQGTEGSPSIFDYAYIDAFGKGKQLTVKECEYLIGHHVTEEFYGVATAKEVLQRMVGNLLNIGKRESTDQSYQLLRDSLDLYLAMYPDNVQHLMLQARLYFHLGIWPEKVLDILQHIQALDPSQHGAVGYLVQHTLEHIERRKEEVGPDVKLHSEEKHKDVCYSVGLVMKHKRYGYNCVIYGWDPACMMGHEWIRNMNVHSLPHGPHQPFYNVLVEDGSCRYAAQENLEHNLEPGEIPHPDIGRYFMEFAGTHYVANAELEIRYPEDLELTRATVQKTYNAKKE
ncbi:nitric oxide synthase, brain isoform X7 [Hemicordylus capensis]|uniref:nitric oxide synthase, brain isoform X7 n=1 Tax=Hemicordylus capensis TaxID=884348 RepID=UPI00230340B2|nr:nitric oxide synthase, brain isoform X7 [Hemicordylus capensis]